MPCAGASYTVIAVLGQTQRLPCQQSNHFSSLFAHLHQQHVFLLSDLDQFALDSYSPQLSTLNSQPSTLSPPASSLIYPHTPTYTMDSTTHTQPLADRDTNTHLANANIDKSDMKADLSSMDQHRQTLQGKLDSDEK